MSQDVNGICSNGKRIARCLSDYFICEKRFLESIHAFTLSKCLHQRLWEDSSYQLKQLTGVGMVTAKALLHAGINSFEKLLSADPRRLESLTGRKYPFGNHVKESLDSLPPNVSMTFLGESYSKQGISYTLQLTRTSQQTQYKKKHFADLVVGTEYDNKLLFHEKIRLEQFSSPYQITIRSSTATHSGDIVAAIISEEYVGIDVTATFASSSGESQNTGWKKRSYGGERAFSERRESDLISSPPVQEKLAPQDTRVSPKEHPSKAESPKEAWAAGSFSGPTFSLLPDSNQQPKRDTLDGGILEQDDSQPESRGNTAKRRVKVTKLNVFDHIKKKARKLPGLSSVGRGDTLPYSEKFGIAEITPNEHISGELRFNRESHLQIDTSTKFGIAEITLQDHISGKSHLQDCLQETTVDNLDQLSCKDEPQSRPKVMSLDRNPGLTPNEGPWKDLFPLKATPPKQSSPVSLQIACGRQEDNKPSFMGCTSIFSFL